MNYLFFRDPLNVLFFSFPFFFLSLHVFFGFFWFFVFKTPLEDSPFYLPILLTRWFTHLQTRLNFPFFNSLGFTEIPP